MVKKKRRKDGRYSAYVFMGYGANGKEKRKYVFAYTEKELEKKLFELKMSIAKGELIDNDKITVKEWADTWLKTYKSGKEYKTIRMYETTLDNHIVKELGHLRLVDLKPFHIQGLINSRYKQGLTRTLETIKLTINQMLKQAVENEMLVKNPASRVELPTIRKEIRRALTDEEIASIKISDIKLRDRVFVYICMYAGLRKGEALALTKNDVKNGVITINKTIVFKNNRPELKNYPKSEAGIREVPIINELKVVLDEYLKSIKRIYLFECEKGGLITHAAFKSMWSCIWKNLNRTVGGNSKVIVFDNITCHMLRHTFATMLYYAGVDIKQAQYLLGHASVEITLNIYTHLKRKESRAGEKLNEYLTVSKRCQINEDAVQND